MRAGVVFRTGGMDDCQTPVPIGGLQLFQQRIRFYDRVFYSRVAARAALPARKNSVTRRENSGRNRHGRGCRSANTLRPLS